MALCPKLERSLSLLEPGGGRAERQAGAALMPMVFVCTGCGRPVGTSSWAFKYEESGCLLLRSRYNTQSSGDKTKHC